MSQFQRLALLIGALIVVLLIALVAITSLRQSAQVVVVTPTGAISSEDATSTQQAAEFIDYLTRTAATEASPQMTSAAELLNAAKTAVMLTSQAPP